MEEHPRSRNKSGVRTLGDGGYAIPHADMLPHYKFRQTHVGCAEHGDPACLCDVQVKNTVPVQAETITYGVLALQVVGGELDANNLHEFASIVLGCTETAGILKATQDANVLGNGHRRVGTAWSRLDDTVRDKMLAAVAARTPWRIAKMFLPETISADDRRYIMKYYNQKLHPRHRAARTRKEEQQ